MMLSCLSRRVLGLNSSCRVKGRWLRFDVMGDFLDYVWVSDVGDDAHGATTQWTYGNINIKDSFESLSPSQGSNQFICSLHNWCLSNLTAANIHGLIHRL